MAAVAYRQKIDWLKQEILAISDKLNNDTLPTSQSSLPAAAAGGGISTSTSRDRIISVLKRYRYSSDGTQTLTSTLNLMELWASLLGDLIIRYASRLAVTPLHELRLPLPSALIDAPPGSATSTTSSSLLPSLVIPNSIASGSLTMDDGSKSPRTARLVGNNNNNLNGNGNVMNDEKTNTSTSDIRHPLPSVQACLPAVLGIIQAFDGRLRKDKEIQQRRKGDEKDIKEADLTPATYVITFLRYIQ
jgi:hypothetical protein